MTQVLVIAGSSMVGRHLLHALRELGIEAVGTSRTPQTGHIVCDVTDPARIEAVVAATKPRWIFQCAGGVSRQSGEELWRVHVDAPSHVLQAVARHCPDTVTTFFGSAAEYGLAPAKLLPLSESAPTNPNSEYGKSKLQQTHTVQSLTRDLGLRSMVVRPFNILGVGMAATYFAAKFCKRLVEARQAGQTGLLDLENGANTRDWIDVRDVVSALLALHREVMPGRAECELFNIATGQERSVLEVATHLGRLAGDFHPRDVGPLSDRPDIPRSVGDANKLRDATGWVPAIPLEQTLADLWHSFESAANPPISA